MVASVPELTSRTISTEGRAEAIVLRDLHLGERRRAERRAAAQRLLDGRHDRRMAVPQDVGAVAADVVDVAPAVLAFEVRPLGRAHEDRLAADAPEGADGGVDAAGEDLLGALRGWRRSFRPPCPPAAAPPRGRRR